MHGSTIQVVCIEIVDAITICSRLLTFVNINVNLCMPFHDLCDSTSQVLQQSNEVIDLVLLHQSNAFAPIEFTHTIHEDLLQLFLRQPLVRTCEDENIQFADIIIHTKYPINSERLFGFSVRTPQANVNCGLILHDYECTEMTLDETRPPLFTEDEWEYLLPQLESNGLLGVPLNVFWREGQQVASHPHIIGVLTENRAVYFFSNYYVRVVYKVVNDNSPPELSDLFIDDGACLKGVYVKLYERNPPK